MRGFLLLVITNADVVAGRAEGIPGNVEPAIASEQLVGMFTDLQEFNEMRELRRIARPDVCGLAEEVLGVLDTTNQSVDARVAEARIDDDGTDHLSGGFQQHVAAIGHVHHVLHGGFIVWVFSQVDKLAKFKVWREPSVIDCCVHNNAF